MSVNHIRVAKCVPNCDSPPLRRKRVNVSPEVGPGLFQPPRRDKGTAAEGVEQKAIMQDEGKHPQADPVLEQALSHPTRLALLNYLMERRETGTDEEELVEVLDLSASRVKYHLLVLRSADLIAHVDDLEQGTSSRYIVAASAGL